jgi:hypothetical protein
MSRDGEYTREKKYKGEIKERKINDVNLDEMRS